MLQEKDRLILSRLREDSRESVTSISQKTGIPISTLCNRMKKLEDSFVIKYVSLLDYRLLGFNTRLNLSIKAKEKEKLKEFLLQHQNVNSVFKINNGYDFYVETIFKDMNEMYNFLEILEDFGIVDLYKCFLIEDLKREGFKLKSESAV